MPNAMAVTYYSRASGNWNANGSWSTVTYGNATNTGTFPTSLDSVFVGDGHTITINVNSACLALSVGQGASGIVVYTSAAARTLTITGNLIVNPGGKFWYNGNSSRSHTLTLGGNLSNIAGTFDLNSDVNDRVLFTINGGNSTIIGDGFYEIYNVTLNLLASTNTLTVISTQFENAITNNVTFTQGRYIHNNSSTFNCNPTINTTITQNASLEIPQGSMWLGSGATTLFLQGSLIIDGGSLTVARSSGGSGIRTDQNGIPIPYFEISSGSLTINGGFTNRNVAAGEAFQFIMKGGTINLETGTTASSNEGLKITDIAGSIFEMDGGTIIFNQPNNSGSGVTDLKLCGTLGNVYTTGGTMQFGTATTASGLTFSFKPFTTALYPNMIVNNGTLRPESGSSNTAHYEFLSLQIDPSGTFDNRSNTGGANGDSKNLTLKGGLVNSALNNNGTFTQRLGTVIFADDTLQTIDGSSATIFYNFEINNAANLTLNVPLSITNVLTLTNGIINTTSTNLLTLTSAGTTGIGSNSSYISGPMKKDFASSLLTTLTFPIGANGFYRPAQITVKHSSAGATSYWGQVVTSPAAALPYALPGTLSKVSTRRYWQFVRTGVSNFTNATAKLYYGIDDGVTDFNSLRVGQGIVATWADHGGVGSANYSGNITSASFTTFSGIFTLANTTGGSNALPVELINFNAERCKSGSCLSWATAAEINNDYFEVQRSIDGINFDKIGQVQGNGNSTIEQNYSYTDIYSPVQNVYYRLKQVDYDGKYVFSDLRIISGELIGLKLFPTISNGENVFLDLKENGREDVKIKLINKFGQSFSTQPSQNESGEIKIQGTESLSEGAYFAIIESNFFSKAIPFFIVR